MTKLSILLGLLCSVLSSLSHSKETITYGYISFPPFMYPMDEHGQTKGITKELLELVAADLNMIIEFQEFPVSRYVQYTQAGKIDFFVVSDVFMKNMKLQTANICTQDSVMTMQPSLFYPKDVELAPDLSNLSAHTILIPKEAYLVFSSALPQGLTIKPYESPEMMVKMLVNQRTSFILDYDLRTEHLLDANGFTGQYKQRKLQTLKTVTCMRSNLYDAEKKVNKIQKTYLDRKFSKEGEAIFKNYKFPRPSAPAP